MYVIVAGSGRVGSGLAQRLEADRHQVAVVDIDPGAVDRLGKRFGGTSMVGDVLDRHVLERAGIVDADALALVTGRDEVNAVVARLALRRYRVPRVVARMYEPRQAELYQRLGALTISPVEWGITRLAGLLTLSDLAPVASMGGGRVQLVETTLSPALDGKKAGELEIAGEAMVVSVQRGSRTFLGDRNTPLASGDVVSIAVVQGSEERLQELLGVT